MTEQRQPLGPDVMAGDPNCPISITPQNAIPNYAGNVSTANIADAQNVVSQLTFADIWRLPPFRISFGTVHLGVMGVIAGGGRTWQIDINDVNGYSTIAATTVQGNLATASTSERQQYVQQMVRRALEESLSNRRIADVNGPCR
ncbi:hypothetical protein [Chitinophaga flava]|uniref:Lipoprotein n=1 Tax=Chitinophaga flava TaxID=2259036 RepID=A0A365XSU4_9BACT|nr:hypothetical protein [Chitinophaga flava]RBL89446.1 hypothetical protein DF182_23305 [Chitinophaga flava]